MATKPPPSDLPTHAFSSVTELETFLEREHTTAPGIYLKMAKKGTGIPSITWAEAVDVVLCFGWIDGRANRLDDDWWTIRLTPRRSKSIWSQKNVSNIARLVEAGRMRPAGLAVVEAAKADGRWDRAYAGPATIAVPDDLAAALAENSAAAAFFETLGKSDRYSVLWRVETASRQARPNRIETLVRALADGRRPADAKEEEVEAKPKVKKAKSAGVRKTPTTKTTTATTAKVVKKQGKVRREIQSTTTVESSQAKPSRREGLRRRT